MSSPSSGQGHGVDSDRRRDGILERFDDPSNHEEKYPPDWDARRRWIYQRDDYTCGNCGVQGGPHAGDDGAELHAHHVLPLEKGGTNRLGNLRTVCVDCHDRIHASGGDTGYGSLWDVLVGSSTTYDGRNEHGILDVIGWLAARDNRLNEQYGALNRQLCLFAVPLFVFAFVQAHDAFFYGEDTTLGLASAAYCVGYTYWIRGRVRVAATYSVLWWLVFLYWAVFVSNTTPLEIVAIGGFFLSPVAVASLWNHVAQWSQLG